MTTNKRIEDQFTRDERMEMFKLAGQGYSAREISQMYKRHQTGDLKGKVIEGRQGVKYPAVERVLTSPEAARFIGKFRTEWLKTIKEVPVAEKKVRLADLEHMRVSLMNLILVLRPRRPGEFGPFMTSVRQLTNVLSMAKDEMEQKPGFSIGIGLGGGQDFEDLTDKQLQSKRGEIIRRLKYVLSEEEPGGDKRTSVFEKITGGDEEADSGESA